MSFSVVGSVNHLICEYRRFLLSTYRLADKKLRDQFEDHIQQTDVLVKGPYVTLANDFAREYTLKQLCDAGVGHKDLLRLKWTFGENQLYLHQEATLRRVESMGRNCIVKDSERGGLGGIMRIVVKKAGVPDAQADGWVRTVIELLRDAWLVRGEFRPPTVNLDNGRILARHVRSFVLEELTHEFPRQMAEFVDDLDNPSALTTEMVKPLLNEVKAKARDLVALSLKTPLKSIRAYFEGRNRAAAAGIEAVNLESSGRVRSFCFCGKCGFASEEIVNSCPQCDEPNPVKSDVAFIESFEAEQNTQITSTEEARQRVYFERKENVVRDGNKAAQIHPYPFFYLEYRKQSRIVVSNWGKKTGMDGIGEMFDLCPSCGKHRPAHLTAKEGERWAEDHAKRCNGEPRAYVLGYEFPADYGCLKSYRNQPFHHLLDKNLQIWRAFLPRRTR